MLLFLLFTKTNMFKFQFNKDRGPARKPVKPDVASSLNIVILIHIVYKCATSQCKWKRQGTYITITDNSNLQGKLKKVRVIRSSRDRKLRTNDWKYGKNGVHCISIHTVYIWSKFNYREVKWKWNSTFLNYFLNYKYLMETKESKAK